SFLGPGIEFKECNAADLPMGGPAAIMSQDEEARTIIKDASFINCSGPSGLAVESFGYLVVQRTRFTGTLHVLQSNVSLSASHVDCLDA
ncbi:unnamed protein product, partial [Symbiodinium pilosum]